MIAKNSELEKDVEGSGRGLIYGLGAFLALTVWTDKKLNCATPVPVYIHTYRHM
jgi:hypothetical protein